jgi:hypothetical protein
MRARKQATTINVRSLSPNYGHHHVDHPDKSPTILNLGDGDGGGPSRWRLVLTFADYMIFHACVSVALGSYSKDETPVSSAYVCV